MARTGGSNTFMQWSVSKYNYLIYFPFQLDTIGRYNIRDLASNFRVSAGKYTLFCRQNVDKFYDAA